MDRKTRLKSLAGKISLGQVWRYGIGISTLETLFNSK